MDATIKVVCRGAMSLAHHTHSYTTTAARVTLHLMLMRWDRYVVVPCHLFHFELQKWQTAISPQYHISGIFTRLLTVLMAQNHSIV